MNAHTETAQFDDVKRRLRPGDVFQRSEHDWKTQSDRRWKGSCPWHDSSSGTCFSVNPQTLEWKCFSCDRGGGPLQYVAELEGVGSGARGALKGKDFFRVWEALSRHAGCEGPPDFGSGTSGGRKGSDRRPRRNGNPQKRRKGAQTPRRVESASTTSKGGGNMSRDIPPRGQSSKPTLDTPESEPRSALVGYRDALKESGRAWAYVEGRGLSVGTLYRHGCGFAPAGQWIGQDNAPRLVTPHTTPEGRLVNLSGRFLGSCDPGQRHRHIGGNPTALFNASAIEDGDGPLVLCEGPLDALSFIEAGHDRTVALHNTDGLPWAALRGNAETLVFAFDRDDTGREDATERAREALIRGFDAHTLHDEDSYAGHGDPNDALQAGELTLDYLEGIGTEAGGSGRSKNKLMTDGGSGPENKSHDHRPECAAATGNGRSENKPHDRSAEGLESPADGTGPKAGQSPASQAAGGEGGGGTCEPADLAEYWNGTDVGHLGRWLWERGGVPEGDVGAGLYADRELHVWIKEKLEAGPQGTSEQTKIRLRWVLWLLYAAHGPEEVPESQIPIPPMRRA